MIGAIAGDIIGARFERYPVKTTEFSFIPSTPTYTDDTVLTVAVADAILSGRPYGIVLKEYANKYWWVPYGRAFRVWKRLWSGEPYGGFGNGSAMRVSPVGWAYNTAGDVLAQAKASAEVTHNHPEGIKGAQCVALSVYMARNHASKDEIRSRITARFGYNLDRTIEQIRPDYKYNTTCQGSVPESIIAFLDSESYEGAVRNAISLGGDADTMACIAGAIAEPFYGGVPKEIYEMVGKTLPKEMFDMVIKFNKTIIRKEQNSASPRMDEPDERIL